MRKLTSILIVGSVFASLAPAASAVNSSLGTAAVLPGTSFSDWVLGTIASGSKSNFSGELVSIKNGNLQLGSMNLPVTFSTVSLSGSSLTSGSGSWSSIGSMFSFSKLDAGNYTLKTSGPMGLDLGGQIAPNKMATPSPDSETYAMFLAGLGIIGAVVRRRQKNS